MFGFFSATPQLADPDFLGLAERSLSHRGPDDKGLVLFDHQFRPQHSATYSGAWDAGLGHRRLAILDPTDAGHQPMTSASGDLTVAYNGELYNFAALKSHLINPQGLWRSTSDTEVLAELLDQRGLEGLNKAVGMFAFAFVSRRDRSLTLVRDQFGIKPLYYRVIGQSVYFSSEIRPLLRVASQAVVGDCQALARFVASGITDDTERTMFRGIRQVLPGMWITFSSQRGKLVSFSSHWFHEVDATNQHCEPLSEFELLEAIVETAALHSVSDVPVSMSLSGGVDSSLLLGALRKIHNGSIDCFSYSTGDSLADDEKERAALFASKYGARLHVVEVDDSRLYDDLEALTDAQEQPYASTSVLAQNLVFRAARISGYKVMIDGQGADELFGGYEFFRSVAFAQHLIRGNLRAAKRLLNGLEQHFFSAFVLNSLFLAFPGAMQRPLLRRREKLLVRRWIGRDVVSQLSPIAGSQVVDYPRGLRQALAVSRKTSSLPMLLRYADRNAMHHSIENRTPFLTSPLLDLSRRLRTNDIVSAEGAMKVLLRSTAQLIHQEALPAQPRKIGFGTSQQTWTSRFPSFRSWMSDAVAGAPRGLLSEASSLHLSEIGRGNRALSPVDWRMVSLVAWAGAFKVSDWQTP